MDKDDFLREMYLDTVGHDEAGLKRYEHMVNIVSSRFRHGPKTEERAVDDAMLKVISEKYITLPLYLMEFSHIFTDIGQVAHKAPAAIRELTVFVKLKDNGLLPSPLCAG